MAELTEEAFAKFAAETLRFGKKGNPPNVMFIDGLCLTPRGVFEMDGTRASDERVDALWAKLNEKRDA